MPAHRPGRPRAVFKRPRGRGLSPPMSRLSFYSHGGPRWPARPAALMSEEGEARWCMNLEQTAEAAVHALDARGIAHERYRLVTRNEGDSLRAYFMANGDEITTAKARLEHSHHGGLDVISPLPGPGRRLVRGRHGLRRLGSEWPASAGLRWRACQWAPRPCGPRSRVGAEVADPPATSEPQPPAGQPGHARASGVFAGSSGASRMRFEGGGCSLLFERMEPPGKGPALDLRSHSLHRVPEMIR